jgi:hypothetical protein
MEPKNLLLFSCVLHKRNLNPKIHIFFIARNEDLKFKALNIYHKREQKMREYCYVYLITRLIYFYIVLNINYFHR